MKSERRWPPVWLENFYCHWVHRINQVAVVLVSGAMIAVISALAWTLLTAEPRSSQKNSIQIGPGASSAKP